MPILWRNRKDKRVEGDNMIEWLSIISREMAQGNFSFLILIAALVQIAMMARKVR